jgi:uncharacterized protein (UPF0305 family)
MEALQELIQALTISIESLTLTLSSNTAKSYVMPLITGLIGTFSGLAVVMIQTRNADRRTAEQREEDRRKDVYKSAAVELARLPKHITSLRVLTEGKPANTDELLNMTAVLAQVVQVAPSDTARVAMDLSGEISKLGTKAINELMELQLLQNKINAVRAKMQYIEEYNKQTLIEIRNAGIRDGYTNENKRFLDETLESCKKEFASLSSTEEKIFTSIVEAQLSYLRWCKSNLSGPLNLCFELQIKIRKDFGNADGESDLRQQYDAQKQNFDELFQTTIDTLEKTVAKSRSFSL